MRALAAEPVVLAGEPLAEAPYAFLTTHAEAAAYPDEHWRERAAPSADSATFVVDGAERFGGMVAAFAADDPTTVVLVAMWVDPSLRGTGVAAGLVDRVVDWARTRGAARVVLTVEAGNDRARRLYERCGFVPPAHAIELPYGLPPGAENLERTL